MPLKVYGSPVSVARVLITLIEKGLEYERIEVNFSQGENKTEEYLKMHPFGKAPVLVDGDFVIYESRAICKYLARKYPSQGTKLMPEEGDYEAYGKFEQACSVEQSYFGAAADTLGVEKYIKKIKGLGLPDQSKIDQAEKDLDRVLSIYDNILSKQKFITGDELSLVDLFHLPSGAAWWVGRWVGNDGKYPNVERWWKELLGRESWREVEGTGKSWLEAAGVDVDK